MSNFGNTSCKTEKVGYLQQSLDCVLMNLDFLKQLCKLKIRRNKVRESKTFSYGVVKRETNFQVDICHMLLVRMKVTFSFVINWRYVT